MSVANLTLRFACEVAAVLALVWWGWAWLGIALGVIVILVWAAVVAPKARRRLPDPWRLLVELVIFAAATGAFLAVAGAVAAAVFGAVALVTALLIRRWPEPVA